MPPEFRVALLGQGFMGKAHSNAYVQAPHFYDLPYRVVRKVICGRDTASLSAMADRWGWDETATDWRAVIERKDIDAVDICLPNHLHGPVAIAAAHVGKTVLCEKPLALALGEARAVAAAGGGGASGRARRSCGRRRSPCRSMRRARSPMPPAAWRRSSGSTIAVYQRSR